MVRLFHIHFSTRTILAAIGDTVAASLIVFSVFYLPGFTGNLGKYSFEVVFPGILLLIFWLWVLYTLDLYDTKALRSPRITLQHTAIALGIVSLAGVLLLNVFPNQHLPVGRLEVSLVLFAILSVGIRWMMDWSCMYFGFGERLLILGSETQIEFVRQAIRDNPHMQIQAMGCCELSTASNDALKTLYPHVSTASRVEQQVRIHRPHRIVVSQDTSLDEATERILLHFRSRGIAINTVEEFSALAHGKVPVDSLKMSALIYGAPFYSRSIWQALNRMVNIVLAATLLIIFLPVGIIIALAIVLESGWSFLYSQERVGFRGQTFRVIKFRSMRSDAELKTGPTWASKNDPRITRVGAVLRKLRLDEIPQLWNVLLGEMNLVGPRPERPHFVEILRQHIPFYDLRHSVRPGITGWAQVMAAYGDSIESSRLKVEYDIFYLQRASLSLDMYILFRTIKIALSGRGAQ
ncbi:MAG TPA: sugar transferase [Acidobacteriaceae bacterium]|jgi:exopolysaccharide biosynthesis polyprenyl glycosylphosphotransferase|nr:sugar transferase [Acidobacteriaceae bacterium]